MALSWRVIVINGLLFAVGTALLAFTPATVSERPLVSELVVLVGGLAVIVVANAALVRGALRPVEALIRQLTAPDAPGTSEDAVDTVADPGPGPGRELADAVNDLLRRIDRAQRESRAAALAGQEAERARIAQELHDGVGQSLTAVMLELGVLADATTGEQGERLDRLRETTRAALQEVRDVARQLRPHVLEDLGLRSALSALTSELFPPGRTHVTRSVAPGLPRLDDTGELVVFRVAQEALTNVARHAGASTVEMTLTGRGRNVVLTVTDDGHGIAPGADGTGLRGMRERAALVGGDLDVRRREGGGTVVTLTVPAAT